MEGSESVRAGGGGGGGKDVGEEGGMWERRVGGMWEGSGRGLYGNVVQDRRVDDLISATHVTFNESDASESTT